MARSIWTDKNLLARIVTIIEIEEDRYTDIPGFDKCEYMSVSSAAVLLILEIKGSDKKEVWFPFSQLRLAEDRQSIYCSNWILTQKGLG